MPDSASPDRPSRPILVPVDFEPAGRAALVTAARLCMCTGVPITVLHVVHTPADRPDYYARRGDRDTLVPTAELARRMLGEFLLETLRRHPELKVLESADTLLVHGLPHTRIPEVARLVDASQIVMGRSRTKGVLRNLFTPSSERIANRCDIPVTVVYSTGRPESAERPTNDDRGPVSADVALSP